MDFKRFSRTLLASMFITTGVVNVAAANNSAVISNDSVVIRLTTITNATDGHIIETINKMVSSTKGSLADSNMTNNNECSDNANATNVAKDSKVGVGDVIKGVCFAYLLYFTLYFTLYYIFILVTWTVLLLIFEPEKLLSFLDRMTFGGASYTRDKFVKFKEWISNKLQQLWANKNVDKNYKTLEVQKAVNSSRKGDNDVPLSVDGLSREEVRASGAADEEFNSNDVNNYANGSFQCEKNAVDYPALEEILAANEKSNSNDVVNDINCPNDYSWDNAADNPREFCLLPVNNCDYVDVTNLTPISYW